MGGVVVGVAVNLFNLFGGGSSRAGINGMRSFVSLAQICFRSIVTAGLNVAGVHFLPSITGFGHLFGIPARGNGLKLNRGSTSHGVLVRSCKLGSGFFGRVSTSMGHGYHARGSVRSCLFVCRKFSGSLVVLVNGLVR